MLKPFLIEALGTFMQLERHVEAGHDEYNDWAPGALDPETQQHAGNGSPSAVRRRPRRLRR